ncbi:TPA: ABC transporter ATP-binding protein [Pasteurella multocida]|uniref:ABC transporter ATP-binding protein n=1 Tax=Pasteurella multocida TaxID=747 RepID=UPI000233FA60|nr:ABC transporter ATP-binding protein [Pasteurella multocida]AWW60700.1 ABC transporter ATP-binding protein [Pasteurellaceae bacterium 12591]AET16830.1 ABC transporter ATP-binding protein [Pasteurella multocida 36950]AHE65349.1 iron complex transport system ATP-binding protein [Pasteurella multocida subsp. multocida str. HB03]AIN48354.1 ABC transporter family protein [Pasteurella multocida]ANJ91136.1 ABC transporter ATP-binding protein [Pasteurella multocida subsp. multocida HB01]
MSLVTLKHVSIGYKKQVLASDLNLQLEPNQVVCLLGANGCGKTTLLKTLLGLLPTLAGEILLQNRPHFTWTQKELAQFIGYVPQVHHLFHFTVQEVVLMGRTAQLAWYSSPKQKDIAIAEQCLSTLGIAHLSQRFYHEISGGERQLVLIARALAQQPAFLIMDEPTSNLDFGNQIRVLEKITQLKQTGLSILMTTHQPEHSFHVADRTILFHQGRIIANGTPKQTLTTQNLAKIYQLDEDVLRKNLRISYE